MGILRTRMEQDLVVRGRSEHTCRAYLRAVTDLARYHHRSPDQLSDREVQQYLRYLIEERRLAWASCRQTAGALRFFYEVTLGRKRSEFSIPLPKVAKRLPQILSREEVARVLDGTQNLKHRVLLMTTYAAGLRVNEVVRVRVTDIDSQRMLIRVEQGKGKKDRYTLLSPRLLVELRRYYRIYRPAEWLFTDRRRPTPMDPRSASRIYQAAKQRAGIPKAGGIHTMITTMLSVTNPTAAPGLEHFDAAHYDGRRLSEHVQLPAKELVSTFGHGRHTCPAQRFSISAIRIAVRRLVDAYEMQPRFAAATARPQQLGGVARAARPCRVDYQRR